ncbi:Cobalt transport protein CbiM [Candidatus Lokiarchaeum ossiferum]|uniref:Cobalt transport protein CbiM n=1 Tax=Candidatus Lokiarchaeum ossiferum TaxID=2951803 RepID=A0ABY6HP53_9ARCH|nr:Cobalt transport protein CbiM [Candidatus Lokiarchaeum sp. B-35]
MHIPEGLLDLWIVIPLWIVTIGYGSLSLFKIKKTIKEDQIAIISVITAMVFALQMLNFPIAAGTSGHFLGFILMAILISPSAAFIMISVVLIIQAFIFADGGIIALGANIFNMGIATLPGYFAYWSIRKKSKANTEDKKYTQNLLIATFVGAYISVVLAATICGIEVGLSSSFPFGLKYTVPTMLGYHLLIALGEGLITTVIVAFFHKYAPEYLPNFEETLIWS